MTASSTVQVVLDTPGHVQAMVTGRTRTHVVDFWPDLGVDKWLCTCELAYRPADGSDCPHVAKVRAEVGR